MHEIICPHCSKAFKIDEAGYADILKQVRDGEFEQQLYERLELAEREKRDAIALAEAKVTNALQKAAAVKDAEIQALKAQLDAGEVARKLAVMEVLGTVRACWGQVLQSNITVLPARHLHKNQVTLKTLNIGFLRHLVSPWHCLFARALGYRNPYKADCRTC